MAKKTPYEMLCLLLDRVRHSADELNNPDLEEHERQSAHDVLFECQQIPVMFEDFELDMRRKKHHKLIRTKLRKQQAEEGKKNDE